MAAKTLITTPYPTVEEVASELGVSEDRVRELRLLAEKIVKPERKARSRGARSIRARKSRNSAK
jgi:hypothetical protein